MGERDAVAARPDPFATDHTKLRIDRDGEGSRVRARELGGRLVRKPAAETTTSQRSSPWLDVRTAAPLSSMDADSILQPPKKRTPSSSSAARPSSDTRALVAAVATSCGGGSHSSAGQGSAADFIRQVTTQFSRGQSGPLWDALHPVDQAVVTRARYMGCKSNSGFDLTKFKVLQTYPDTIDIAGTATPSTAVSVRVAADDGITTATMHAVRIEGTWRWVLSQADYTAYKHGKCPSS
jgi:hypothetical protein